MKQLERERYAAVCEASPDAILLVDDEGEITYANTRVTDFFGYLPGDLIGEPIERLVPEPQRDAHVGQRNQYLANPETRPMGVGLGLEARCKDGSTIPVDISLSPIETDGQLEVMAAVRDIRAKEMLRARYQTILEAVPDAVLIADANTGHLVEVNDQMTDLSGYESGELIGNEQTLIHPSEEEDQYRALFAHHIAQEQAILSQFPDGSDVYIETKSGGRVPVEINARVFEFSDRQFIVGVFRNITVRKERERQLKELSRTTRQLLEAADPEEITQRIADAADQIHGYARTVVRLANDECLNPVTTTEQARTDLGPRPTYSINGNNPASQCYRRGELLHYDDVQDVEDGYDRGNARSAMYLPMGEHGVISIIDPGVDAFDQSDIELASILAANATTALDRITFERELERQNARLNNFADIVSHDLRNPLNVAQGWLDAAEEDRSPEAFERVETALKRMEEIVNDTLILARQGQTVGEQEPINITQLAKDCWEVASTAGGELEIVDEFQLRGDRDRLQHIFENLFRNAIDHGGDDVTVTIGTLDDDGFYIEDDGPGIPENHREKVFDEGYSLSDNGTGFGLAIGKEIVNAHGWSISVTDSDAGGARFEISGVEMAEG